MKPVIKFPKRSFFHKLVNYFLAVFLFFFVVFLILLGYTQTASFRELARDKILAAVNDSLNGRVAIGTIDGTIFTTLTVRDAALYGQGDTVIRLRTLNLKFNPWYLFSRTVYVQNITADGLKANLYTDSAGKLNITKIFPPTPKDTSAIDFPFKIKLAQGSVHNTDITFCPETKKYASGRLQSLDYGDIRLSDFNLDFSAVADINPREFSLSVKKLSTKFNVENFDINNFSGDIYISKKIISLSNLEMKTNRSDMVLNAELNNLNVFADSIMAGLASAPLSASLTAKPFHFDDLSALIPVCSMLHGSLTGEAKSFGSLNELNVEYIKLFMGSSNLQVNGKLQRILDGADMQITAFGTSSRIYGADVNSFLPTLLHLPSYAGYESVLFDSATFNGTPLTFSAGGKAMAAGGVLTAKSSFDFVPEKSKYDLKAEARNLNLEPIIHHSSDFNGSLSINGEGFNPRTLDADIELDAGYTTIGRKLFKELMFRGSVKDGELMADMHTHTGTDSVQLYLAAAFPVNEEPSYSLNINAGNLNLGDALMDSLYESALNFNLSLDGSGLHPDSITGNIKMQVGKSELFGRTLPRMNLSLQMSDLKDRQKLIRLTSDLADAEIKGSFRLTNFVSLLYEEITSVNSVIINKLSTYFPEFRKEIEKAFTTDAPPPKKPKETGQGDKNISAEFSLKMKDIWKINVFIPGRELNVDGSIKGNLFADDTVFAFTADADVDFAKYVDSSGSFFADKNRISFLLKNIRGTREFNQLSCKLNASSQRIFSNAEFRNNAVAVDFNEGVMDIKGESEVKGNMAFKVNSSITFGANSLAFLFRELNCRYNNFEWKNRSEGRIWYKNKSFTIENFALYRGDSRVLLSGVINMKGRQDLNLKFENLKGYDISYSVLNLPQAEGFDNDMNLTARVQGTLSKPEIKIEASAANNTYKKVNFGSFQGGVSYADKKLLLDCKFFEQKENKTEVRLALNGFIPIYLGTDDVKERLPGNEPVSIELKANEFNINTLNNVVPGLNRIEGKLNADVSIGGTFNSPNRKGYLRVQDTKFFVNANNLEYNAGVLLNLSDNEISIDSFLVQNSGKVKNKGKLTGTGKIDLSDLDNIDILARISGDLTVLGYESKSASPAIYGDLFIKSKDDIIFSMKKGKASLRMPLLIREASLVFPPLQSVYSGGGDNFYYRYPKQEVRLSAREMEIQKLMSYSGQRISETVQQKNAGLDFDYSISAGMQNDASVAFIFSQEANQRLNALLSGDVLFERKNGIQNFQGELKLLEGSTLDFIKTFSASGSLRFESDVTNPNLDITGVYKAYYVENDTSKTSSQVKEEEVAVKVKLKGPLNEMAKSFQKDDNSLAIYYGKTNIEKSIVSTEYDKADAIWFVLLGKFKKDLTQQDKSRASSGDPLTGTATSVASTVIGGLLNSYFGDAVRSLEIRNTGTATKFNLSGRYKNFKYTIGGSTNFLQDFTSANVRIEYPIIDKLIMRIERKEAVTEINYTNEMMSELGFRYSFEF